MLVYKVCIVLHLFVMGLWLGHMFVWSLFVGPAMKRIEPAETASFVRERSLFMGGLGWPALAVLVLTGSYMLSIRGYEIGPLLTGQSLNTPEGRILSIKLLLVLLMIFYQAVFGHRRAPLAVYLNMLAALVILATSVLFVRGWN